MVNSPTTMARVRKAPRQQGDADVRQDDLDDDPRPAGSEALCRFGQRADVDRLEAGVDRPVHVRERQDDIGERQQGAAADVGVGERQRRMAERADQAEDEHDRRDDERQERDELDERARPRHPQPDPEGGRQQETDAHDDRDDADDERIGKVAPEAGVGGAQDVAVELERGRRAAGTERIAEREDERPEQRHEEVQEADEEDDPPPSARQPHRCHRAARRWSHR